VLLTLACLSVSRICCMRLATLSCSARASRVSRSSGWLSRPFCADRALPAADRGPVDFTQGLCSLAQSLSRFRPSGVRSPRFWRLRRPAATRAGLFEPALASLVQFIVGLLIIVTY